MQSLEQNLARVQTQLEKLESLRLELLAKRQQARQSLVAILASGGLLALAAGFWSLPAGIGLGIVTGIALIIVYAVRIAPLYSQYRMEFKQQFIANLLSAMTDQVRYEPAGDRAVLAEYHRSELFPTRPDREQVEDTIFARIGATDLIVSEIHTEYKQVTRDKDGKESTTWHTIFRGLFVSADFHKEFRGRTFVRSDTAEKLFGRMGRMFQKPIFSQLKLVELEDVEFEREFVVHSDDQIEARYILTPALMQRMHELKTKVSSNIEFSFLHSRVFLALSHDKNLFEPRLPQSLRDPEYIRGFLAEVQLCLGIVEDLDLNTRLWSKA